MGATGPGAADSPATLPDRTASPPRLTVAEFNDLLFTVLFSNDLAQMPAVAAQAVARYAGFSAGTHLKPTWFLYRTLQQLKLPAVLDRLMDTVRLGGPMTALDERLQRDEFRRRIAHFRAEVAAAVRRCFVQSEGVQGALATYAADEVSAGSRRLHSLLEDVHPDEQSASEIAELRRAIGPLSRKFAARMVRRHRTRAEGRVDIRRTMRAALDTGGVPSDPRFRRKRRSRPEIFVLVDISGSVAKHARFLLELVYAMSGHFRAVRSFVFVDDVEEVTEVFTRGMTVAEAAAEVSKQADESWAGHISDYGLTLENFWDRWGQDITPADDGHHPGRRPFQRAPRPAVGRRGDPPPVPPHLLAQPRAPLGVEPGGLIIDEYEAHVDGVFECGNVRQLERFIDRLT